jgi:hypothetical protein
LSTQAEYDSIVGANPTLVTTDMNNSEIAVTANMTDDGELFKLYPAYNNPSTQSGRVDFDITYHGIIHSDVPPSVALGFTLPVEISDPSI